MTNETQPITSTNAYKAEILMQTLTNDLQRLSDSSKKFGLNVDEIESVLQRIEAKQISVAVVGEFKRGKSTFINALLGDEVLPADILPATATLNRITYGAEPAAKVCFKEGDEQAVAIEKLTDYVTKLTEESKATAARIKEAVITYPTAFGQGVDIIDTPGLTDNEEMSAVTIPFLDQCDVAIMVIMADSPFGMTEETFFKTQLLPSHLGQILFVVNGIDRLNANDAEDVDRVVNLIESRLNASILAWVEQQTTDKEASVADYYLKKFSQPRVFGLSAFQALQAKRNNDEDLLTQSRFVEFETALKNILMQERGGILLQVATNQAIKAINKTIKENNEKFILLEKEKKSLKIRHANVDVFISILNKEKIKISKLMDSIIKKIKNETEMEHNLIQSRIKNLSTKIISSKKFNAKEFNKNKEIYKNKIENEIINILNKKINDERVLEEFKNKVKNILKESSENMQELSDDFFRKTALQLSEININDSELKETHHKILEIKELLNFDFYVDRNESSLFFCKTNDFLYFKDIDTTKRSDVILNIYSYIISTAIVLGVATGYFIGDILVPFILFGFLASMLLILVFSIEGFIENFLIKLKFGNYSKLTNSKINDIYKINKDNEKKKINKFKRHFISEAFKSLSKSLSKIDELTNIINKGFLEPIRKYENKNISKIKQLNQIQNDAKKTLDRTKKLSAQLGSIIGQTT